MKRMSHETWKSAFISFVLLAAVSPLWADEDITITPDLVYGHKHGMALTMDVFQPQERNGTGVLFMVSGGWYSSWAPPERTMSFLSTY